MILIPIALVCLAGSFAIYALCCHVFREQCIRVCHFLHLTIAVWSEDQDGEIRLTRVTRAGGEWLIYGIASRRLIHGDGSGSSYIKRWWPYDEKRKPTWPTVTEQNRGQHG